MPWTCYSCGAKNPNSAEACQKCGNTVAAPRDFYIQWVFGGAVFFVITYIAGVLIGATFIEFAAAPSDADLLAWAQAEGETVKSLDTLDPTKAKEGKAALIAKSKAEMSGFLRHSLLWLLPALLFIICGAIVGFVSDGKTIWEAGIASIIGQLAGFAVMKYLLDADLSWIAPAIAVVPGFGLAVLGSFLGEIIQDRRERAV